jgi:hypothetical protein
VSGRRAPSVTRGARRAHARTHAGKQTAALFSALSAGTTFAYNVAYNGPRAAINLNDAFGCARASSTRERAWPLSRLPRLRPVRWRRYARRHARAGTAT